MKLSNIKDDFKKDQPDNIKEEGNKDATAFLNQIGIEYEALIQTAMEFYVPHPGLETKEKAIEIFETELRYALSDPNLLALVYSGYLLEQEGQNGTLPGISKDSFQKDLSFIIADEILGEAVANYIAGSKGRFEFVRFDKIKPGILKTLGPFMDDTIGGLLGGVSANMYSRALFNVEEEQKQKEKK